jgi:hypothetical protein
MADEINDHRKPAVVSFSKMLGRRDLDKEEDDNDLRHLSAEDFALIGYGDHLGIGAVQNRTEQNSTA